MDKNNKFINFIKNKKILIIAIIAIILIFIFFRGKNKFEKKSQIYSIDKICELATLKCYYHDVAEYKKDSEGLFNYGYKKYWIEYTGTVDCGIDAKEVKVNKPDKNGVVHVYVPEAKILNVNVDKNTMSDPIVDTGIFTSITIEEKNKAFTETQETMKKNAEADKELLAKAQSNAKKLIEQYIINMGKKLGQEYKVEWDEKK